MAVIRLVLPCSLASDPREHKEPIDEEEELFRKKSTKDLVSNRLLTQ